MPTTLQIGDRVRLSELGRRAARKQTRAGEVLGVSRSGTQIRVQWDGVRWPQMIHSSYLECAPPELALTAMDATTMPVGS